ncbi:hypothetical protein MSG28_011510 [Choristoneura fumiferana]|uniref:Uncharacterized protein n=1 Tax=Choristoneura fumiferana TaxID=7141 RepID=A0ACC0JNM9_CHOFU|nr:hypothetical protein MSG28_011510 [Choristoneura fumiferana]
MAERCLYNINGPLMALKAKMIHKELTGLTPAAEAGSSKVVPLEVPVVDKSKEQGVIKVERTSSGDQLVIRVTDKQNSKSNVFNSFSVNDGHFENNIVVKEEREEPQTEEEESEAIETEEERRDSVSEALFPAAETLLGNQESSREDICKALKVCVVTIEMDWRAVEVLDWKLRIGKRSVGCPPTRWTDDLVKDAGPRWMQAASNRGNWRSLGGRPVSNSGRLLADMMMDPFQGRQLLAALLALLPLFTHRENEITDQ